MALGSYYTFNEGGATKDLGGAFGENTLLGHYKNYQAQLLEELRSVNPNYRPRTFMDPSLLGYERASQYKKQLERIFDLPGLFNQLGPPTRRSGGLRPTYSYTMPYEASNDPIRAFLARTTFQYDPDRAAITLGGTQPTVETLQSIMAQNATLGNLRNYNVVDIETAGLRYEDGAHQIALLGTGNAEDVKNWYFENHRFRLGSAGSKPLDEFMRDQASGALGTVFPQAATEDDFAQHMLGFMEHVKDQPIVGHNIYFDLNYLSRMSEGIKADDPEIQGMIKSFQDRVLNQKDIYDTAELARLHLGNIISEGVPGREAARFSMESILTKTNLIERMGQEGMIDTDQLERLAQRGSHTADVDVVFQRGLTEMLIRQARTGQQQLGPLNQEWAAANTSIIRNIQNSGAITPNTNLISAAHADPRVVAYLKEHRPDLVKYEGDEVSKVRITYLEHQALLSRITGMQDQFLNKTVGQSIFRRTYPGILEGKGLAQAGIPTAKEFERIRGVLNSQGIPYSGLGFAERYINEIASMGTTASMGGHIAGLATEAALRASGGFSGVTAFEVSQSAQLFGRDTVRNIKLPLEALRDTGFLRPQAKLGISTFETATGRSLVTANLRLSQRERVMLRRAIAEDPTRFGIEDSAEEILRYTRALAGEPGRRGVQVGVMSGSAAQELRRAINDVRGTEVDRSTENTFALSAHVLDSGRLDQSFNTRDILRVGALQIDKGPTLEEMGKTDLSAVASSYRDLIANTSRVGQPNAEILSRVDQAYDDLMRAKSFHGFESMASKIASPRVESMFIRADSLISRTSPMGRGVIGAGLAVAGLLTYRHHQRKELYDRTLDRMPYESDQSYYQGQRPVVTGYGSQPLRTAGLVNTLNSNKTRHTFMGNSKNSHLYGGGY